MARNDHWTTPAHEVLRAGPGFDLSTFDRRSTPGWTGGRKAADARIAARGEQMSELQERLFTMDVWTSWSDSLRGVAVGVAGARMARWGGSDSRLF